ncbi:hypothetical protein EYR36_000104 [Pleurotus pulmonarius]|nr:hypothetical protein EYR36_000104 [Pleurotus pulmonarius]
MLLSTSSDTPSIEDIIDAKIKSLYNDITLMHAEILRLKEYRNTGLPTISKLPPEVLTIVFESIEKSEYISFRACDHLLAPTQVCRSWRRLALSLPHIWARIDASAPPDLVELFLERAGSAPISLQSTDLEQDNAETLDATLDRLDRLNEITFCTTSPRNGSNASRLSPLPNSKSSRSRAVRRPATLTNLRSLKINTASRPSLGTAHYTNPVGFFASLDGLPFLSSLDLINAFAPLNGSVPLLSVSLPNLTHVSVSIEDTNLSNPGMGMMSCIRAPLISTTKLLHTGQPDASTVAVAMPPIYIRTQIFIFPTSPPRSLRSST